MIPILYEKTETGFVNNGLGRLRDCISCIVTEERNGIYECDFEYPITGANYELIQIGRIIGVTHEDTNDIQPFDIVSFSKPIDGIVTFHCTHISYRQSYYTVKTGSAINSLSAAFTLLGTAQPTNPFSYQTDKTSSGYLAAADGTPRSVRELLGGIEGSILDAYGGEYEFDKWTVYLHSARGQLRNFDIRYGVNMLEYNDETDSAGTYSSVIPYWTDGTEFVVGDKVDSGNSTITGRGECVPLDVSDKFETKPTKAQVESQASSIMSGNHPYLPTQTINVSFVRLQDLGYENLGNLLQCRLCDTVNVIFPDYGVSERFKIVKTVYNVLSDRFDEMELGTLSTTLSEALGISNSLDRSGGGGSPSGDISVDNITANGNITATGNITASGTITSTGGITAGGLPSGLKAEEVVLADDTQITGNSYGNGSKSVAKTGYTPIGIVGMHLQNATNGGAYNTTCAIHSFYLSGSTAYWIVRTTTSNTAKIKVTGTILYAKS